MAKKTKLPDFDGNVSLDITTEPLGVSNGKVYIEANLIDYGTNKDKTVLVELDREEYLKMLNLWLDAKQDYCERYGHFCGQNGSFLADDLYTHKISCSSTYDTAYTSTDWGEPDMEHG
jgi:hypothetical protein